MEQTNLKTMGRNKAIDKAIDYCIGNNILREFLETQRAEVISMWLYEYNQERHIRNEKNNSYKDGVIDGINQGAASERINTERERKRADAQQKRADAAEAELKKVKAELAALQKG